MTETATRTPLWQMTDEQLRAYVEDDLVAWDRRQTCAMILEKRHQQANEAAAEAAPQSEVTE